MLWAPPAWNNPGREKQLFSPGLPLEAENNVSAWATIDISPLQAAVRRSWGALPHLLATAGRLGTQQL